MARNLKIATLNSENVFDRLRLCWGHLDDWRTLEIVQKSKQWLDKTNASFKPTTFIAYKGELPAGMIEFFPQKLLPEFGLCPCRMDVQHGETPQRYNLGERFDRYLFISCLLVSKENQGKGVGRALLNCLMKSKVFDSSDGALVYVTKRDETWTEGIHWPAGPKEFYQKAGFALKKTLDNPTGYLLVVQKG